jgi:hypothetical protein
MAGSINREIIVQEGLGKKWDLISKVSTAKRAGGIAQVVEHLPDKWSPQFKPQYHKEKNYRSYWMVTVDMIF